MLDQPGLAPGAQDTIYLCNFRVSVDGDWLCLKQLDDVEYNVENNYPPPPPISPPSPVEPLALFAMRDPMLIERSNLVNISKLVVKELIETSHKYGRMLDSDHLPLQHFFIVLEHVLRHGIKPKKGLLGPKKELWDILQLAEKFSTEATDTTRSVRELPTVQTAMGRARAWLRLALMQKKLADYLKLLVDRKEHVLADYYEPDALLMCDEAFIIVGLLVGLNVIDCNLCVKEEDLDCQQGVIDFSLYLRSSHHYYHTGETVLDPDNMTTVLDQKNYIEELNRHLNATVANLEKKVENLQTTNALMKEDLDIAKKNWNSVTEENSRLKKLASNKGEKNDEGGGGEIENVQGTKKALSDSKKQLVAATAEIEDLKAKLKLETEKRKNAEKELKLQVSMKSEMEVAMKLLEKDIHEKQEIIVSLRKQLDEIKNINLEMCKKLQDCESSLKQKTELATKLEEKTVAISETLLTLEDKLAVSERSYILNESTSRLLEDTLKEREQRLHAVEKEIKLMKEVQIAYETTTEQNIVVITGLEQELTELRSSAKHYLDLKEEHSVLKEQCRIHEMTLEELGTQLSMSKLKLACMEEEAQSRGDNLWTSDKDVLQCRACAKEFNMTRRKHHCRNCGDIFCNSCSDNTYHLPSSAKPVRVCDTCHVNLVARNSVL